MPSRKHLVLDDDVHAKLASRKRRSRRTIREIGNTMLRSILSRPALSEIIGTKLIEEGWVDEDVYERIRSEALKDAAQTVHNTQNVIHWTPRGTLVAGSWEAKEVYRAESGDYQIVEAWARDGRERPMPTHCHEGMEVLIVQEGSLLATIEDRQAQVIDAPGILWVPSTLSHTIAPIARKTRILAVLHPPEASYVKP